MQDVSQEKATVLPNPHLPREAIVEECQGCNKVFDTPEGIGVCIAYGKPVLMQRNGGCALQSNKVVEESKKQKVNPLKASRRMYKR